MTTRQGITVPIYKIDTDAVIEIIADDADLSGIPSQLVARYNAEKGEEIYIPEGKAEVAGCRFELYRNVKAKPNTSNWVQFFKDSGIELGEIKNQMQHLVCFAIVDDELYAYTAGQSAVVFERFVDISFPIEVGRRIAKPEVKGARSSQITGSTLASTVHFRDPRRITYTESLENVWTALSGQLRDSILGEPALLSVFGPKTKIRLDVTSAVKLGPRIETPEKLVEIIRWLAEKAEADLPADDGWGALDAIKLLNPRKRKDLIGRLKLTLAQKVFSARDYSNLVVSHAEASLYDNATRYVVRQGRAEVYEGEIRPELPDIVGGMDVDVEDLVRNLDSVVIRTENTDYGAGFETRGSLLTHLHGEVRHDGKTFFLLSGKWYEVDAVYIDQVTKDFFTILGDLDLPRTKIGMREWKSAHSEGEYNQTSISAPTFINGDRVLTDNVELFDGLASDGETTYLVHVKRGFDVKVRDVRSQVINSAQIIENDLRAGTHSKLTAHHRRLTQRGRTSLSESDFLTLFELPRVYVLAYGSKLKVSEGTISNFNSSVARMELVSLSSQFRQLVSAESQARLRITWIEVVK